MVLNERNAYLKGLKSLELRTHFQVKEKAEKMALSISKDVPLELGLIERSFLKIGPYEALAFDENEGLKLKMVRNKKPTQTCGKELNCNVF